MNFYIVGCIAPSTVHLLFAGYILIWAVAISHTHLKSIFPNIEAVKQPVKFCEQEFGPFTSRALGGIYDFSTAATLSGWL